GLPSMGHAGLQTGSADRGLLRRLSEASLHLVLYGTRLQVTLYLLPLAPDGRRTSLPRALDRKRRGRGEMGEGSLPSEQGILLRRRHPDRQPAARRSARQGVGQNRRYLVVQCQGECAAQDARRDAREWPSAAAGRL